MNAPTDIVEMARAAEKDERLSTGALYGKLADEIERLRDHAGLALRQATRLLESFVSQHFPPNPDWKPQSDLMGVILQLDNASTIARDYKAEIERLRAQVVSLQSSLDAGPPRPGKKTPDALEPWS